MKDEFEWRPGHALKSLASLPRIIPEPGPARQKPARKTPKTLRYKEPVVGSEKIKWKPIDVVAKRVVAKAPWHCKPPQPKPKMSKMHKDEKFAPAPRVQTKQMVTEEGYLDTYVDADGIRAMAIADDEKRVRKGMTATEEMIERAKELVSVVEYLTKEIMGPWAEHQEFIKAAIATTREQRIALGTETRLLMSSLKEVRQFFLEDDYQEQMARLHDFVDLCERLKTLKDSGFLDAIADTILKLS